MTVTDETVRPVDRERIRAAVCEPRAEIFAVGTGYVRGWATARTASEDLAAQLQRAGLAEDFGGLRADVTVSGQGLVCVGMVRAEAVRALAVLVARGLSVEMDGAFAA